jgi:hypothetical protein
MQGAQAATTSMAERQGATPPAWLGRSRLALLRDVLGGVRENLDKVRQLASLVTAFFRPRLVRRRLERLRALGHVDAVPTIGQLLVAGRDQMMVGAAEETKIFYRAQGIPWIFHNLRRFLSGPATMLDPVGFFSPREAIVEHVLQTFHRHPVYDLVLLRAHDGGVEALERGARQVVEGTHPHQRALASLIEDGSYHARLPSDIAKFEEATRAPARPIPSGLVDDPELMLAMDQFKDVAGFARYASRLRVGFLDGVRAWLAVGWDETLGGLLRAKVGPRHVEHAACDPELVTRHLLQNPQGVPNLPR